MPRQLCADSEDAEGDDPNGQRRRTQARTYDPRDLEQQVIKVVGPAARVEEAGAVRTQQNADRGRDRRLADEQPFLDHGRDEPE